MYDDEENYTFKKYNKEAKYKKENLCANDVDSSEEIDSYSSHKDNNFMLMAIEYFENEYKGSDLNDEESMVDMEDELISALEEIDRIRLKKRKQKQLLMQYENNGKKPSEDLALLKLELEEAKKIEDIQQQLTKEKMRCEVLEEEVVTARKELEKFQALYHQNLSIIKA